jgi:hypothetical protein
MNLAEIKKRTLRIVARVRHWTRHHVPFGLRLPLGLIIIALGFLGFLPVLGFWMIPVGIAVAALDVAPMWRWARATLSPGKALALIGYDRKAKEDDEARIGEDH